MKKRRLLVAGILASWGFIALVILLLLRKPAEEPISRSSFDRIQLGMTEEEVEQVIGLKGSPFRFGQNREPLFDLQG